MQKIFSSKLFKFAMPLALGLALFGVVMAMPVVNQSMMSLDGSIGETAAQIQPWLIDATKAQTATVASIASDVDTTLTAWVPDYKTYIVFAIIAALALWLLSRAIRSGKSS